MSQTKALLCYSGTMADCIMCSKKNAPILSLTYSKWHDTLQRQPEEGGSAVDATWKY